jgi:hypothetical protein
LRGLEEFIGRAGELGARGGGGTLTRTAEA